jgi:hypothetical protein
MHPINGMHYAHFYSNCSNYFYPCQKSKQKPDGRRFQATPQRKFRKKNTCYGQRMFLNFKNQRCTSLSVLPAQSPQKPCRFAVLLVPTPIGTEKPALKDQSGFNFV